MPRSHKFSIIDINLTHTWRLILFGLSLIYLPLIWTDPILGRDDQMLIQSIAPIHSLSDYFAAFRAGQILDVQPVRDFTLIGDLFFKRHFGWGTFHLTNVFIWAAILAVSASMIQVVFQKKKIPWILFLLFAIHPVTVGTVAWISARKHLLSALFILAATRVVVTYDANRRAEPSGKTSAALALLFLLSCASHPLHLLWPIWAYAYLVVAKPKYRPPLRVFLLLLPCFAIAGICAWINHAYYSGTYLVHSGGAPKVIDSVDSAGASLLALGRYLFQMLFPFRLATSYYPGSYPNLIGLGLIPILGLSIYKGIGDSKPARLWILFGCLPLSIVTLRMTNIFVSDTYLIIPLIAALMLLMSIRVAPRKKGKAPIPSLARQLIVCAVFFTFLIQSYFQAQTWSSDLSLWEQAYRVEPSPTSACGYATQLISKGMVQEATGMARRVEEWNPSHPCLPRLKAETVFLGTSPIDEKIDVLRHESSLSDSIWYPYYLSFALAQDGKAEAGFKILRDKLASDPIGGGLARREVEADLARLCRAARDPSCTAPSKKKPAP